MYAGVGSGASNLVVKGDVYGIVSMYSDNISYIQFDLGLAAEGYPVDVAKLNIIYSDTSTSPRRLLESPVYAPGIVLAAGTWAIIQKSGTGIANPDTDHVLRIGQTYTIRINPLENEIPPRESIHIEIRPEVGASLAIGRSVPSSLATTTVLTRYPLLSILLTDFLSMEHMKRGGCPGVLEIFPLRESGKNYPSVNERRAVLFPCQIHNPDRPSGKQILSYF